MAQKNEIVKWKAGRIDMNLDWILHFEAGAIDDKYCEARRRLEQQPDEPKHPHKTTAKKSISHA
jgi:hypothetical protein